MGIPEHYDLIWEGCEHTEEERGDYFNEEEGTRWCGVCDIELKSKWICVLDKVEPVTYIVPLDGNNKIEFKACPKCGALYEYLNPEPAEEAEFGTNY